MSAAHHTQETYSCRFSMPLKTRELHGTSGGRKNLRITGQQKSVEAMLRLKLIRSVKIPQGKVIHTSLTELTAFYFWSGELVPGLT